MESGGCYKNCQVTYKSNLISIFFQEIKTNLTSFSSLTRLTAWSCFLCLVLSLVATW